MKMTQTYVWVIFLYNY